VGSSSSSGGAGHLAAAGSVVAPVLLAGSVAALAVRAGLGGWASAAAALGSGGALLGLAMLVRMRAAVRVAELVTSREVLLRESAGAVSAAPDPAGVRAVVLDVAARLLEDDLRFATVATVNDRGAALPESTRGPEGPLDPLDDGVSGILAGVPVAILDPIRFVAAGSEVVVAPIPARFGPRSLLVVAGAPRVPPELDEVLAILCSHAALAVDALAQGAAARAGRHEARFRELVHHSPDAIVVLGTDRRVRYQSPSVVRVLGYLAVDLDGAPIGRILHPEQAEVADRFLGQLAQSPHGTVRSADLQLMRADGAVMHAEVVGANLVALAEVDGVVLTIRDVTGRRSLEDQLRHQALHDPLTGLPNRALFTDRVEHALDRARRDDRGLAVAFIDLDDFKDVNDSLGHSAGDELLKVLADRVRGCLRSGDTPARLGGDEFAVLLEAAPDSGSVVKAVAERILDALEAPVLVGGTVVHVRASIGVAARSGPTCSPAELLRNADLAMYAAKATGKGRVEVYEPDMRRRRTDRRSLTSQLERSVTAGDIDMDYQPIVSLASREIVGVEALVRWMHPERGPISPAALLPLAEEAGLVVALGRLVLEQACEQVVRWQGLEPARDWCLAVNLSATQLLDADSVALVREVTSAAGLDPRALTLELTESVLLSDSENILARLRSMKELGVRVALDDFGTGYSSLSYLQRVPFDVLKIDRAFVRSLRTDDPAATLAGTIVDLARTLGRTTIAEGIEDEAEVTGLLALGCKVGQGHLLGPAVDAATLELAAGLAGASLPDTVRS
jgi:diguanylate cyclase (GGDEF)-like protein/PAS domain S-box-containing protein